MAGSSAEETLEAGIRAARKLSMDGTRAIYDLTSGIDFSKPRRTAEAIARVAWEQDVESWWTWEGAEPVFKPNRTVEIRLPRDPDRKVARAAAEFQADLKEEFAPSIDSYLYSLNDERADWFSIFFLGPLWTYSSSTRRTVRDNMRHSIASSPRWRAASWSYRSSRPLRAVVASANLYTKPLFVVVQDGALRWPRNTSSRKRPSADFANRSSRSSVCPLKTLA